MYALPRGYGYEMWYSSMCVCTCVSLCTHCPEAMRCGIPACVYVHVLVYVRVAPRRWLWDVVFSIHGSAMSFHLSHQLSGKVWHCSIFRLNSYSAVDKPSAHIHEGVIVVVLSVCLSVCLCDLWFWLLLTINHWFRYELTQNNDLRPLDHVAILLLCAWNQ